MAGDAVALRWVFHREFFVDQLLDDLALSRCCLLNDTSPFCLAAELQRLSDMLSGCG